MIDKEGREWIRISGSKEVDAISCDDFNVSKHNTADFRLSYVKVFNVRM